MTTGETVKKNKNNASY